MAVCLSKVVRAKLERKHMLVHLFGLYRDGDSRASSLFFFFFIITSYFQEEEESTHTQSLRCAWLAGLVALVHLIDLISLIACACERQTHGKRERKGRERDK